MLWMVLYERILVSILKKDQWKNDVLFFNIVSVTSASLSMLPSACGSNPCLYGGTCVANLLTAFNDSYLCQCSSDRIGINCEHRKYNIRKNWS
jgi:hypothetical protein